MAKKPRGLFAAKKLAERRKKFRFAKKGEYSRRTKSYVKFDPFEGAPLARGIVLEKREVEVKQPHSGLRKCVRVQLIKNGRAVTAHIPMVEARKFINEHDEVLLERAGAPQRGALGDMPGVKFRVVKVAGISLKELVKGKKQKPVR